MTEQHALEAAITALYPYADKTNMLRLYHDKDGLSPNSKAEVQRVAQAIRTAATGNGDGVIALWNPEYEAFLEENFKKADRLKREGDMYGWNFYEGMRSGAIQVDIELGRIIKKLQKVESPQI